MNRIVLCNLYYNCWVSGKAVGGRLGKFKPKPTKLIKTEKILGERGEYYADNR